MDEFWMLIREGKRQSLCSFLTQRDAEGRRGTQRCWKYWGKDFIELQRTNDKGRRTNDQ